MLETPKRYSDFLAKFGGLNPYGEPNFILTWCETPVRRIAVPEQFFGPYLRSWVLAEWSAPEEFGSPSTWDEDLMQQPYPSRGLYFPLQIFRDKDGVAPAQLDSESLNLTIISCWVYNCINHKRDSLAKRKQVFDEEKAKRDKSELDRLADRLQDAYPAFGKAEALSYAGHPEATSALKSKMEQIERQMPNIREFAKRFPKKHSIIQDMDYKRPSLIM